MSKQLDRELARAGRELAATEVLIEAGFPEQAVSRSYYAMFHAAVGALLTLGETRSKHSGVISAFSRLMVHQGGFDPEVARPLRRLFRQRNEVDYGLEAPSTDEARERLAQAARFVDEVERWIESHSAAAE
jgi:uncharacterized protein